MKLEYTKFQIAIELITVILLLLVWVLLFTSWSSIPDKIPAHYNAAGIVDRWGNKNELFIMPIANLILYILLTVVSFFPSTWNAPVKITEENREFVYLNLKNMLILLKMEVVATFSYISYCSIKLQPLGIWFLPLELTIVFGTIIYFIIRVARKKANIN